MAAANNEHCTTSLIRLKRRIRDWLRCKTAEMSEEGRRSNERNDVLSKREKTSDVVGYAVYPLARPSLPVPGLFMLLVVTQLSPPPANALVANDQCQQAVALPSMRLPWLELLKEPQTTHGFQIVAAASLR